MKLDEYLVEEAKKALDIVCPPLGVTPKVTNNYTDMLAKYMAALMTVNEKINLTGAKDLHTLAVKHIADSCGAWNALDGLGPVISWSRAGRPIYDVGSGGGLPGIVLAILSPHIPVVLIERKKKKAAALREILELIGLQKNIDVIDVGFEEMSKKDGEYWFRGFMPGDKLIKFLSDNFDEDELGKLVLMKGPLWEEERKKLMSVKKIKQGWVDRFALSEVIEYELPNGAGKRKLVLA